MSAVNELVVREYFELLGYMVSQPRKYSVPGRQKKASEELDLVVHNPGIDVLVMPDNMVWTTDDLKTVPRAVIGVRGWHTERFYASTFDLTPGILRFAQPAALKFASSILASDSFAKILCLPKLPASGELKKKTIQVLKDKGVSGVISFQTILSDLVTRVDINRNYDKSDILQVIRLLKNYDLLKDSQMDLFDNSK